MKLAVRDENLLVGRLEKYNRRKSPRAAIGKKWSQHDLATKVQLLGCECSDLTILRIEKRRPSSSPTTKSKPSPRSSTFPTNPY